MDESILQSIKSMLGLKADYTPFDKELVGHINSAIMVAHQLGVGKDGFLITGSDETWSDWLDDREDLLAEVPHYIYLRTRLSFDTQSNSFVVSSLEKQIDEMTWRLNVQAEEGGYL